jgi:NADH-quinone oxidoreductase subunit C
MPFDAIVTELKERFGAEGFTTSVFRDNRRIVVATARLFELLQHLKERHGFDMLAELTCADYLKYPGATDRVGVIYCLVNISSGERLYVKTLLNEPDLTLPSAYPLWQGADWLEREVYDMFGILFEGHPDLRRILMPDAFTSYPLRKDYPLRGKGERHNFPAITRAEG